MASEMSPPTVPHTPVVLFTYRKADFLPEILRSVERYGPSVLYISSDGAANAAEEASVEQVRETLRNFGLSCRTEFIFYEEHLEINDVFHQTLDYVFTKEERLIVLEDDTVPSDSFFVFCDRMLQTYARDQSVGCIQGCNLQADNRPDAYFLAPFSLPFWGWATWKDRWTRHRVREFDRDTYKAHIAGPLNERHERFFFWVLDDTAHRVIWDLLWSWTLFSQGLKCVLPGINLVKNKGFLPIGTTSTFSSRKYGDMALHDFPDIEKLQQIAPPQAYEQNIYELCSEFAATFPGDHTNGILS